MLMLLGADAAPMDLLYGFAWGHLCLSGEAGLMQALNTKSGLSQCHFGELISDMGWWRCRHTGGPKRLTGAAAMAVAAAQRRAAVSAPAEVSANGTPEPLGPAASAPLQQQLHSSGPGADAADVPESRPPSDAERVSPDTDAASAAEDILSQRALSDNNGSVDKAG